jgi:hypothetical protein
MHRYILTTLGLAAIVLGAVPTVLAKDHTVASANNCGVEGSVRWRDGSKSNKSTTISTSWNSQKAYPDDGWYSLDLGSSACGQSLTVYLDGNQGTRVTLPSSGHARVDFTAR